MSNNAYDIPLLDGLFWKGWRQTQVSTALGAINGVGFYPVNTVNYTVFKVGSTYYCRDVNGEISSSSTCATLVQEKIDLLEAAIGGNIQYLDGTFTHEQGLTVQSGSTRGVGLLGLGRYATTLYFTTSGDCITIGDGATTENYTQIRNMKLVGRGVSYPQNGIVLNDARRGTIDNVEMTAFKGAGKYAIKATSAMDYLFHNNHLWSNQSGMLFTATNCTVNKVTDNFFYAPPTDTGWHIDVEATAGMERIIGNTFEGSTNRVRFQGDTNIFTGNTFEWNVNASTDVNVSGNDNHIGGNIYSNDIVVTGNNTWMDIHKQSAIPADLSGAATTQYLHHSESQLYLVKAYLLYTEAASADAGITLKIGKETDDDYYYTGTSNNGAAEGQVQWWTDDLTLLENDVAEGDTVTFTSAGGKAGVGEVICILEFVQGGS